MKALCRNIIRKKCVKMADDLLVKDDELDDDYNELYRWDGQRM